MKNRTLLMIPGPIEFDPAVLAGLGAPTTSHVSNDFIEIFGQSLESLRQVFLCDDGQPFILAGSGTLAMDTVGANLVEPGDRVLVINTGYFGDRFGVILERYGAEVTQLRAKVGERSTLEEVGAALRQTRYKMITVTHVDTSTGVMTDVQGLAALASHDDTLLVVDGVCSVAGEELRMSDWGVDVVLTASQKAVGVPPGLALVVAGGRAMQHFKSRKTTVMNYYADWNNWLPVMQAYEARQVGYFGTPAVNLVRALHVSLQQILEEGMDARFARHVAISRAFKAAIATIGLGQVPISSEVAAHTMTAPRYPNGVTAGKFLPEVTRAGVTLAGGLHPAIKSEYFRIGHMGVVTLGDTLATVGAIEKALADCGHRFKLGSGVEAALQAYQEAVTRD
jgi:alanine-glyoxylate transaminase/serine-glyoxylate transaminase/serine-pyruvate transaminase